MRRPHSVGNIRRPSSSSPLEVAELSKPFLIPAQARGTVNSVLSQTGERVLVKSENLVMGRNQKSERYGVLNPTQLTEHSLRSLESGKSRGVKGELFIPTYLPHGQQARKRKVTDSTYRGTGDSEITTARTISARSQR